jgi:hypothetical protein
MTIIDLKKRAPARKPKSLFHFLRWCGGLKPHPDLYLLNGRRSLIRKSGLTLDRARECCVEESFLADHASINDLLVAVAEEAAGRRRYRFHEAVDGYECDAASSLRGEKGLLRRIAEQCGITRQAVSGWKRVPAERVRDVSKITGIPRSVLRPDVYPPHEEPYRQYSRLLDFATERDPKLVQLCERWAGVAVTSDAVALTGTPRERCSE